MLKEALCTGCWQALRQRLAMDGYLLLRGVLPIQDVLEVLCWPHQSAKLHGQLRQNHISMVFDNPRFWYFFPC